MTRSPILTTTFVLTLLFTSCQENKNSARPAAAPQTYSSLILGPHSATIFSDFPATIEGIEIVQLRPMVDGYLEKIYVPEGADVKKGMLLFQIKNPIYDEAVVTAKAAVQSAQANVDAAKMNVEKVRPLVEKDIVSKYELESAQYTLQSQQAALDEANASLRNAQTNVGYTTLRSPITGVMGTIPYKIGDLVSSTTSSPLTTLARINQVYAYFALSEKQLLNLSKRVPGATLQDKLDHLPAVSLVLADGAAYPQKGKLETASGMINTAAGTVSLKAQFSNPTDLLRSGASAVVRIPRTIDTALLVPQSATYQLQDKTFVYLLIGGNRVISLPVTATPTNDGKYLLVQQGLKRGDQILLNGFNLRDSTVVIPRAVNADSLYGK
ncbi:MAG TPA: efflux RND transporter periplasmic adaptor subunit [Puia sp.]|jgi:membrane fusion protein (multidrug efflux system)|nr:efflux RND transporter periplasmic adaptor subunit [Puia sp.]